MMARYFGTAPAHVEQEALRVSPGDPCVWPDCNSEAWVDLDLRVCTHHAAKVYSRVQDALDTRAAECDNT